MDNSKKIILDLCGGTGSWSRPYMEAGYDVRLITLPDYSVTYVVFSDDYMVFNKQADNVNDMAVMYKDVYGILAAPPCTEFSLAKNGYGKPRDFRGAMAVVSGCMQIIWHCQIWGNLMFWALENPLGMLRKFLGRPKFTFQHWQYGDANIKPTDIWGWFNTPNPSVKVRPDGLSRQYPNGRWHAMARTTPEVPGWYYGPPLTRAALRAVTPPGFAKAFFKANR